MTVALNLSSIMNPLQHLMNNMVSFQRKAYAFHFKGFTNTMKSIGAWVYRSGTQNILLERKMPFFF